MIILALFLGGVLVGYIGSRIREQLLWRRLALHAFTVGLMPTEPPTVTELNRPIWGEGEAELGTGEHHVEFQGFAMYEDGQIRINCPTCGFLGDYGGRMTIADLIDLADHEETHP